MKWKGFVDLLKETVLEWSDDNASRLSAALAYYTVFSLVPLLVIGLGLIGRLFGGRVDGSQMARRIGEVVGPQAASVIGSIAQNVNRPGRGLVAEVVSAIVFLAGTSGVFYELHASLNIVWDVQRKASGGIIGRIRARLPSFLIIFIVGFLLFVAVAASAAVTAFGRYIGGSLPATAYILHAANFSLSFVVVTLLFGIVYKLLPDAEVKWSDVWVGSAVTSLLFAVGKFALSVYLTRSALRSLYGAAGSLIMFLAFLYYSAQIFFFGAEFTKTYAARYGSRIVPSKTGEVASGQEASPK